jgi:hypothetical protein
VVRVSVALAALLTGTLSIFELQKRDLASLFQTALTGPLVALVTPFYFWHLPLHLIFTFLIPVLPFVFVFDGYVSVCALISRRQIAHFSQALRTRTPEEIFKLIDECTTKEERAGWSFQHGQDTHVPIIGKLHWFAGFKKGQTP